MSNRTDSEIIFSPPLCVNVQRLAAYLLAPDEVVFFDWLVIKQSAVFKYKWFYYSQKRIQAETRINRRCLERIIKRFCAIGILSAETRNKAEGAGRVRYFRMDFGNVLVRLDEIIDIESSLSKSFWEYFSAQARAQAKSDKGESVEIFKQRDGRVTAERLYNVLCYVYQERCKMYNDGELTDKKPKRHKAATQFAKDRQTAASLERLAKTYDSDTIRKAFLAYCDDVLKKNISPRKMLTYFLKYDEEAGAFPVVNEYLCEYQKDYTCPA